MKHDDKILYDVAFHLMHSLEGDIPPEQFEAFKNLLRDNPRAREYYYSLLSINASLHEAESVLLLQEDSQSQASRQDLWIALSREEKNAPTLDLPMEDKEPEPIQTMEQIPVSRKKSKFSNFSFIVSLAAMLFIALLLRLDQTPLIQVATLSDSVNAVFAGKKTYATGSRLFARLDSLWLQKGAVEITFDSGARVVIEAPAEFNLNSSLKMTINSGRLYAHVPESAQGFSVQTPTSNIVDMGTEFAVKVDFDSTSDVHMIKGKAALQSLKKDRASLAQILTAGNARRVETSGEIQTIPIRSKDFIREFLPNLGMAWRGQPLDLSDFIGGGCGLGTGRPQQQIDPFIGEIEPWRLAPQRQGNGEYKPIWDNQYIDGVFVPDGGEGPIQVTTSGLLWEGPDTSNFFKYNIVNSLKILEDLSAFENYSGNMPIEDAILTQAAEGNLPLRLMGIASKDTPVDWSDTSIFIHSNLGITFDLDAARKVVPQARITKFSSLFGVGEITLPGANLDIWVLVDGKVKYVSRKVKFNSKHNINIDLSDTDRFLTLVITDGGDWGQTSFDWGLFINPCLVLE